MARLSNVALLIALLAVGASAQPRVGPLPLPNARVSPTPGASAFIGRISCYVDEATGRPVGWTAGIGAARVCRATDDVQTVYVPATARVTGLNATVTVATPAMLAALTFRVESAAGAAAVTCGRPAADARTVTLPVVDGNAAVLSAATVSDGGCTADGIVATAVKATAAPRDAPVAARFTDLNDCPAAAVQTLSAAAPPTAQPLIVVAAPAPAPTPAAVIVPAVRAPAPAPVVVAPIVVKPAPVPAPAPAVVQPLAQAPAP